MSRFVNAVLAASDGSLWIATTGSGVLRHGPDGWTQFDEAAGLPSPHAYALAEVRGRGIFAGTARGLARLEGARFAADTGAGLGTPGVKLEIITSAVATRRNATARPSGFVTSSARLRLPRLQA